eukprot:2843501-Pleurochrysis_carterae.AAC.1
MFGGDGKGSGGYFVEAVARTPPCKRVCSQRLIGRAMLQVTFSSGFELCLAYHDCRMRLIWSLIRPRARRYIGELYSAFLKYAVDPSAEVRQAAVYGIGLLATHVSDTMLTPQRQEEAAQALLM